MIIVRSKKSIFTVIICMITFLTFSSIGTLNVNATDDIKVDETTFPDDNFRAWVIENIGDTLTTSEIRDVEEIDVSSLGISDLTGIEYFSFLEDLDCPDNDLTTLDVSKNENLRSLTCDDNDITSIDVSQNPALSTLNCSSNDLTSIDVTKNSALRILDVSNNNITSLDVSKNPELIHLMCNKNSITSIDTSQNPNLTQFNCDQNMLTSIDVSKNTLLEYFGCGENEITSVDVTNNPKLSYLDVSENALIMMDLNSQETTYDFHTDECERELMKDESGEIDLTKANQDIDVSKISNVTGAQLSGNSLVDITSDTITYEYKVFKDDVETYTIIPVDYNAETYDSYYQTPVSDNENNSSGTSNSTTNAEDSSNIIIIVAIVAGVLLLGGAAFVLIKKSKNNKT